MGKLLLITLLGIVSLAACESPAPAAPIDEAPPVAEEPLLSLEEARQIAESECISEGESIGRGYFNEYSRTWWFDADLTEASEGCNPACVVSEDSSWEINWRCTGLVPEKSLD